MCDNCHVNLDVLACCPTCASRMWCSQDCAIRDHKDHKSNCDAAAGSVLGENAPTGINSQLREYYTPAGCPQQKMPGRKYPHNRRLDLIPPNYRAPPNLLFRPIEESYTVYKLLIECHRWFTEFQQGRDLRQIMGFIPPSDPTIITGFSIQDLPSFIEHAQTKNMLPSWWDKKTDFTLCQLIARPIYHWDDGTDYGLTPQAPKESNQSFRYGGNF
jgi:hypothetical protein